MATKKVTRITRDGRAGGPRYRGVSVSRSGRRHAFIFGNDLYVSGRRTSRAAGPRVEGVVLSVRMRPDGRQVAFTQLIREGPVSFRGVFTVGVPAGSAVERVADEDSVGWLGDRLLRPEFDPEIGEFASQKICLLATTDPFACERDVAIDPRRDLVDPEGSPDGRFVVATAVPAGSGTLRDGGRIALFSAANGNLVRYLTSGPADSNPRIHPPV